MIPFGFSGVSQDRSIVLGPRVMVFGGVTPWGLASAVVPLVTLLFTQSWTVHTSIYAKQRNRKKRIVLGQAASHVYIQK